MNVADTTASHETAYLWGVRLFQIGLTGEPQQVLAPIGADDGLPAGVMGIDVSRRVVRGEAQLVVQLLLDDEAGGFDPALLDAPVIAEVFTADGRTVAREPFDHDRFRRRLRDELADGRQVTRGVLVLERGELPPPWIRLAFLPIELASAPGCTLVVRTTTRADLVTGVDNAYSAGELSDEERTTMLTSIDQRHPA